MKIGDIKAEALRLMFVTGTQDIGAEQIDDLITADDPLSHYLLAMTGSINRALADIEQRLLIRSRSVTIPKLQSGDGLVRYFDTATIPDFLSVDYVTYRDAQGYDGDVAYTMDGGILALPEAEGTYTLLYRPSLTRLTSSYGNDKELTGIPDRVACLIPYYIKGDLFSEDEPGAAAEARNWYEASVSLLELKDDGRKQNRVEDVMGEGYYA